MVRELVSDSFKERSTRWAIAPHDAEENRTVVRWQAAARGRLARRRVTEEQLESKDSVTHMLTLALQRLGHPDPPRKAAAVQSRLVDELNVHTALHLIEAVGIKEADETRKRAEARALLKENLFESLRQVVNSEVQAVKRASALLPRAPKVRRTLTFTRIDVLQVSNISRNTKSFEIELFVQGIFKDGAQNKELSEPSDGFPTDVLGRPTFRPSANWFLKQADFRPALRQVHTSRSQVVTAGNDLQLNQKITGAFFWSPALSNFPFDSQRLTVYFVLNCALQGLSLTLTLTLTL